MPRLDAERIALFRSLTTSIEAISRQIDADLTTEYDLPLSWFEVMSALQREGGVMRMHDLCVVLDEVPSSLSRRIDRMAGDGYVVREPTPSASDRRAVSLYLTREGRLLWRDANVIYRRAVQRDFANVVTDTDIHVLHRLVSKLAR